MTVHSLAADMRTCDASEAVTALRRHNLCFAVLLHEGLRHEFSLRTCKASMMMQQLIGGRPNASSAIIHPGSPQPPSHATPSSAVIRSYRQVAKLSPCVPVIISITEIARRSRDGDIYILKAYGSIAVVSERAMMGRHRVERWRDRVLKRFDCRGWTGSRWNCYGRGFMDGGNKEPGSERPRG